jgi:hypothetical protein
MSVREPAADWYRMLGVEYIGCRGIINDDCISKVAADLGKILKLRVSVFDHISAVR